MTASFTVPGAPVPKARPRTVHGADGSTRAYTPMRTAAYEDWVKASYRMQCPGVKFPDGEALHVSIVAYMPIPKSAPKRELERMRSEAVPHAKKPDADNIAKTVLDAMLGYAYKDDAQVSSLSARKVYSGKPRVEVSISTIANSAFNSPGSASGAQP